MLMLYQDEGLYDHSGIRNPRITQKRAASKDLIDCARHTIDLTDPRLCQLTN